MSVFNFMETFFFISLGITFILILLLVYHFKQRLSTIEQKSDTMFDIINNMVKELTIVKTMAAARPIANPLGQFFESQRPLNEVFSQMNNSTPNYATEEVKEIYLDESGPVENINLEDDDDEEDDDEEEDDNDDDEEDIVDEDEEEVGTAEENELVIVSDDEDDVEDIVEDKFLQLAPEVIGEVEVNHELVVDKLESDPIVEESSLDEEDPMEEYKKLTPSVLKSLILSKGFATDVAKLKKNQLLQILEENL